MRYRYRGETGRIAKRPACFARLRRMETADYFRQKAAQCRRLAEAVANQDDPVVASLLTLAVEFEARAVALAAETAEEAKESD